MHTPGPGLALPARRRHGGPATELRPHLRGGALLELRSTAARGRRLAALAAGLLCAGALPVAAGTTYHVADAVALEVAFRAVNAGSGGDLIVLAPGLYQLRSSLPTLSNDVTIQGDPSAATILDGGGVTALGFTAANVSVSNLTLQNGPFGVAYQGTGVFAGTGLTIAGNDIGFYPGDSGGTTFFTNSTIAGNRSIGVLVQCAELHLTNVTVSGNGTGFRAESCGEVLEITNSVIAGNTTDCFATGRWQAAGSASLDGDGTCTAMGYGPKMRTVPNPGLLPLAANGGPTPTQALDTTSPAINAGDNAACPATDQRGFLRGDGACDIGAYELGAGPSTDNTAVGANVVVLSGARRGDDLLPGDRSREHHRHHRRPAAAGGLRGRRPGLRPLHHRRLHRAGHRLPAVRPVRSRAQACPLRAGAGAGLGRPHHAGGHDPPPRLRRGDLALAVRGAARRRQHSGLGAAGDAGGGVARRSLERRAGPGHVQQRLGQREHHHHLRTSASCALPAGYAAPPAACFGLATTAAVSAPIEVCVDGVAVPATLVPTLLADGAPLATTATAGAQPGTWQLCGAVAALASFAAAGRDLAPPSLALPADLAVDATGPQGAAVPFTASAVDNLDPQPVVRCAPASGSFFPINPPGASTRVSCTATDAAGNASSGAFGVHVRGAREQLDALSALIGSLSLDRWTTRELQEQLDRAADDLRRRSPYPACRALVGFTRLVTELAEQARRGHGRSPLTAAQAALLTAAADRIEAVLACPPVRHGDRRR